MGVDSAGYVVVFLNWVSRKVLMIKTNEDSTYAVDAVVILFREVCAWMQENG